MWFCVFCARRRYLARGKQSMEPATRENAHERPCEPQPMFMVALRRQPRCRIVPLPRHRRSWREPITMIEVANRAYSLASQCAEPVRLPELAELYAVAATGGIRVLRAAGAEFEDENSSRATPSAMRLGEFQHPTRPTPSATRARMVSRVRVQCFPRIRTRSAAICQVRRTAVSTNVSSPRP